jgi:predicted neuraminidase
MKRIGLTMLLVGCVACSALAEPLYRGDVIFPVQGKHVHGSSIVEGSNGDLIACWFYGSGERSANDVLVQGARLKKGADTWSAPFVMADTPDLPDCNPVLFIDAEDRLWMFWIAVMANRWEHSLLKYRRAEDYLGEGPPNWSWQDVIILKPGEGMPEQIKSGFEELGEVSGCWGAFALPYERLVAEAAQEKVNRQKGWMTRIHPIILPSGRIVLPLYSDGFNLSLAALSDDGGETWQASGPMVGYGPIQPTIARKKDGTLVSYMRDSGGTPNRVLVSSSQDDGETWSPAVDSDIPNPSSSLEVIVLTDGRWVMIYNDKEDGRHSLALSMSDDEGKTWAWKRCLEISEGRTGSYAYPSMIQSRDGLIHATFTNKPESGGGKNIKHIVVNAEWIVQGD